MNRFISKLDEGEDFLFSNGIRHYIFKREGERVWVKELGTEDVFLLSPMTWNYYNHVYTKNFEKKKFIEDKYNKSFPTGKWMMTVFNNFQPLVTTVNESTFANLIYIGRYKKQTEEEINNYLKVFKNERIR